MSKYIDLAEQIKNAESWIPDSSEIDATLEWLDDHPDQVPGRTITESDYSDIAEWARNYSNRGWEGRTVLAGVGITIVPDPEPTNAELIERKLRELREEPGEWMTYATDSDIYGFSQALDAKGVKAPGGDDE